jgi:hypothetical protein
MITGMRYLSTPDFYPFELLGQWNVDFLSDLLVKRHPARLAFRAWPLHLAGVTVQGIQLGGKSISDVDKRVRGLRPPEIDLMDSVGLQPFPQMCRIGQMITRIGK